ncbi:hypothetical protein IWGMT90018_55990 [Mycobacterium kiyosense]|nr:hypothetical protein IWGMT90018_55990 [Mycobacterium kiyosense]
MLPVQRPIALIGFGLPDPRALLGGVLGAQGEHGGEGFLVAQHGDRSEAEVARIHHAQLGHVQRAVRFHPLDQHGQLVQVRHDECGGPAGPRLFPPVAARPGLRAGADEPDQVSGLVHPHVVDDRLEFAGADRAHGVLLTARPVGPQQFLQQVVDGAVVLSHPASFSGQWLPVRVSRYALEKTGRRVAASLTSRARPGDRFRCP